MTETIRVNFGKLIPVFPLRDTVLLPHALLPLHIFEPRYVQMVGQSLDRAGQIAIATLARTNVGIGGPPELRPAVCVGQIVQHKAMPDGRFNIVLHGVCRAAIAEVLEPSGERAFRLGRLRPIEAPNAVVGDMDDVRDEIHRLFTDGELRRVRGADTVIDWIECNDVPTRALLEFVSASLFHDTELKYRLLEESDIRLRAAIILDEFQHLDGLLRRASTQSYEQWPKGMSWN